MKIRKLLLDLTVVIASLALILSIFVFGVMYQIGAIPQYMW